MILRALSIACLIPAAAGSAGAQSLRGRTIDEWRERIEPRASELAYAEIPWHASFWEAERVAQREQKPILLWAMNGHPLGCT